MGILFTLLVLITVGFTIVWRSRDGITVSTAILCGSVATLVTFLAIDQDWQHFNSATVLIDFALLATFSVIALTSQWRWPMIVCAMQFVATASHVAAILADTPATRILGVAQGLWAYFQCFAIIFGVARQQRGITSAPKSMTRK